MNDIRHLLRAAERRLEATRFLSRLHLVAIAVAAVALVLAIGDRLPATAFVPWAWVAPTLAGVALLIAAAWWWGKRLDEHQVAVAVDERLGLRERLSTALGVERREDVFARAAVEDAVQAARDPKSQERVRRTFAVAAPSRWWVSPMLAVAAFGILFLPQADLFAKEKIDQAEVDAASVLVENSNDAINAGLQDKPELAKALEEVMGEIGDASFDPDASSPEDLKRDALKRVTELNKKLDDILSSEDSQQTRAIEDMLSRLEVPKSGPAKELAEALARGDFKKASQALADMQEKLQKGNLTPEQKDQLAKQMQQMGEQLQQLAQQQQQLQQALQQAGLNPQLANNPQALQQAIQNAQNLNQQQRQQLQQMVKAQQMAQQACQQMGGACQKMGQGQGQGQGQQSQGMQQLAQQLSDMEQMQQLMQQAQAMANQAMSQCQGLGQGMGMAKAKSRGGGMGQNGQGSGGTAQKSPTPSGTKLTKENVPVVDGEIIASMMVEGHPIRGEAKAKMKQVLETVSEGFDEASAENPLPRRYHEAQKHYFGELQRRVEAIEVAAPEAAAPAETSAPAETGDAPAPADG